MSDISQKPEGNAHSALNLKTHSSDMELKKKTNFPSRIFPNSMNSMKNKSVFFGNIPKKLKTIYVELKNKKLIEIEFNVSEENDLTVGWLLSEAIRKMKAYQDQKSSKNSAINEGKILFLTSQDKNCNLDYWLTFLDRSINVLKDGQILNFYMADTTYEINEDTLKVDMNYFHYQKIIGLGGFSQVILG